MKRAQLTTDQQRVLDYVADLALRGYDARPSHVAHMLNMELGLVHCVLQELERLGLVLGNGGRSPRCPN